MYHDVVLTARSSCTLYCHQFQSSIALCRSSRLHPVTVQNCCRSVGIGQHWHIHVLDSVTERCLISLSLLLLQFPRWSCSSFWTVCEMGGKLPYRCWLEECCFEDIFWVVLWILEWLLSSLFPTRFVSVRMVHPFISMDVAKTWKKSSFIE